MPAANHKKMENNVLDSASTCYFFIEKFENESKKEKKTIKLGNYRVLVWFCLILVQHYGQSNRN